MAQVELEPVELQPGQNRAELNKHCLEFLVTC